MHIKYSHFFQYNKQNLLLKGSLANHLAKSLKISFADYYLTI